MVKHLLPVLLAAVTIAGCGGKDECTQQGARDVAVARLDRAQLIDADLDAYSVRVLDFKPAAARLTITRGDMADWDVDLVCGKGQWAVVEVQG